MPKRHNQKIGLISENVNTAAVLQYLSDMQGCCVFLSAICYLCFNYSNSTHTRNTNFLSISGYPGSAAETYANEFNIPFNSVLKYKKVDDKTISITGYTGKETSMTIPSYIEGLPVTAISSSAFSSNSTLKSVTLPSTLTTIGTYAFYNCTALTSVNFPSSLKSINSRAFDGCTLLKSISLNSGLKTLGYMAFARTGLSAVTIPDTVTTIGLRVFGYVYDSSSYTPVTPFTITGYVDTAAEEYANDNPHITFKPLYKTFTNNSSVNKTSVMIGETITITGAATGGKKPYTYAVYYKKGTSGSSGSYTTIQNFQSNNTCTFKPSSSGTYTIMVTAADYRNVTASKTFTITVTAPELLNQSTISAASVMSEQKVYIYSKASGGEGTYKFAASVSYEGADFTSLRAYSTDSTITASFVKPGKYTIRSWVKDDNGTTASKDFTVTVKAPALINNSVVSDTTVEIGTPITVTCDASGGIGSYTYNVAYQKKDWQGWSTVQDYDSNASVLINLSSAGSYTICVNVKDENGTVTFKYFDVEVRYPLYNNSSVSAYLLKAGETLTVSCEASGGAGDYVYTVQYELDGEAAEYAQEYSSNNFVNIIFSTPGNYKLTVIARDSEFKEASKIFNITVEPDKTPLVNTTHIGDVASVTETALGEPVYVICSANGGTQPYKFAVWYKLASGSSWTTVQSYKDSTYVVFTPNVSGKYDISVKVKDAEGTIVKKAFTLTVNGAAFVNQSTISAREIVKGESVTVQCAANGGKEPYQFAVYYKPSSSNTWTTAQSYKANTEVTFTPKKSGNYDISVKAKDASGTVVKKTFAINVIGPLKNTSTLSCTEIMAGEIIDMQFSATGGCKPYVFAAWVKSKSAKKWTTIQSYSENEDTEFAIVKAGTYDVSIKVKDANGTIVKKAFTLAVVDE